MTLFASSAFSKLFVSTNLATTAGMPPTSMYLRNWSMAILCSVTPIGLSSSKHFRMYGPSVLFPTAQRNSSKSSG